MGRNGTLAVAGTVLMVVGLFTGVGGCVNPEADTAVAVSGWLAFVGGCVLYGASHIVESLRKP